MSHKISVLAIDFDGTLVTCRNRQMAVLRAVMPNRLEVDCDRVWNLRRNGSSLRDALERCEIEAGLASSISAAWVERIEDPFWLSLDTLLPGVLPSLEKLRCAGWSLRLLSGRRQAHWLQRQICNLGIKPLLDEICVVSPARAAGEKAEVLKRWQPVGMVGDTELDGLAARTAGVPFYAVESGQRERKFLMQHGFATCYSGLDDVVAALLMATGSSPKRNPNNKDYTDATT